MRSFVDATAAASRWDKINRSRERCLVGVDIDAAPLDTGGSALTGRPLPAAREYSHLLYLNGVRLAPSFSLAFSGVQAIS